MPLPVVVLCRGGRSQTVRSPIRLWPFTMLLNLVSLLSDYFVFFFACSSLCLIGIFVMHVCWNALINWCWDSMHNGYFVINKSCLSRALQYWDSKSECHWRHKYLSFFFYVVLGWYRTSNCVILRPSNPTLCHLEVSSNLLQMRGPGHQPVCRAKEEETEKLNLCLYLRFAGNSLRCCCM
jgi:hypothetical protein